MFLLNQLLVAGEGGGVEGDEVSLPIGAFVRMCGRSARLRMDLRVRAQCGTRCATEICRALIWTHYKLGGLGVKKLLIWF